MDIPSIVHLFKPQNNFNKNYPFVKNKIDQIITPLPMYKEIEKTGIPCTLCHMDLILIF